MLETPLFRWLPLNNTPELDPLDNSKTATGAVHSREYQPGVASAGQTYRCAAVACMDGAVRGYDDISALTRSPPWFYNSV